jgi:hypothetical protein
MPEKCNNDRKISRQYLDLAYECFTEAAMAEGAEAAEQFRRMGHRYILQAAIFGAALRIAEATRSAGYPLSLWSDGPAHRQNDSHEIATVYFTAAGSSICCGNLG